MHRYAAFFKRRRFALAVSGALLAAISTQRLCRESQQPARGAGGLVRRVTVTGGALDVTELSLDQFEVKLHWRHGGSRLSELPGDLRTNAGIFEPGFIPTGLLMTDGRPLRPLSSGSGDGNFFMLPNGVFAVGPAGAQVVATSEFTGQGMLEATQSGPLLVRNGHLHPSFAAASTSRVIRSGVGVRDGGKTVVIAISVDKLNLHEFATIFRDTLGCADALYLDGVISALWAAGAGRDADLAKGPFAGVITVSRRTTVPSGP